MKVFTIGETVTVTSGKLSYTATVEAVTPSGDLIVVNNEIFEFNGYTFSNRSGYLTIRDEG